jgi:hypothetical protein
MLDFNLKGAKQGTWLSSPFKETQAQLSAHLAHKSTYRASHCPNRGMPNKLADVLPTAAHTVTAADVARS